MNTYKTETVMNTLGVLAADNYARAFGFKDVEYIEKIHARMAAQNVEFDHKQNVDLTSTPKCGAACAYPTKNISKICRLLA